MDIDSEFHDREDYERNSYEVEEKYAQQQSSLSMEPEDDDFVISEEEDTWQ